MKSSESYSNSAWDLVDATSSGAVPLASVKPSELPAELRAMSEKEREAYVADKLAERKAIQAEIAALSAEREAWLDSQKRETAPSEALDTAIVGSLTDLAAAKGFVRSE